MNIQHHPSESLLLFHATGRTDPAMLLILETHMFFCAQCRMAIAQNESIGGVLLGEIAPAPLAKDALEKTLARLGPQEASGPAVSSNDNTPSPLRAFLGHDLSQVRWRRLGPHLGYVTLQRRGRSATRLLRGTPGTDVGLHAHRGTEYTLVLRGGFTDVTGQYGPGDFQAIAEDAKHNPVADPGEDCINLAVTSGRLRFEGTVQKIVAGLFGF